MSRIKLARIVALCIGSAIAHEACVGRQTPREDPSDPAVMTYGYAPRPDGSVRLQPDVVIVGGGARAIKSVGDDGLTWTIDGSAKNAGELKLGQIAFVTSRAVGRVVQIKRQDRALVLTLAPVALTDVVRDGELRIAHEMTPETFLYRELPILPGMISAPGAPVALRTTPSSESFGVVPATLFEAGAPVSPPSGGIPQTSKSSFKIKIGEFDVEPYFKGEIKGPEHKNKIGLKITRNLGKVGTNLTGGLKFSGDVTLLVDKLHLQTHVPIADGKIGAHSSVQVHGIKGLLLALSAGVEHGLQDNQRIRAEVPLELTAQIPPGPETGGIPMVAQIKFKFIVQTAFSSKHATLGGEGRYSLDGPLGYAKGSIAEPVLKVEQSILDNLDGISLGASGIVVAWETRFLVGIGTTAAMAGPYVKVTVATGVSRGSVLGAPLADCKGATLKIDVGGGVGVQLASATAIMETLKRVLGKSPKLEFEAVEAMATVFTRSSVVPDVPICGGK